MLNESMSKESQRELFIPVLKKYFGLTKPRIVILLSLTGVIAYVIASKGIISPEIFLVSIMVGYTSSGGAMAINSYIDRDIDKLMNRTNKRASVNSENPINPPEKIVLFGGSLVFLSLVVAYFIFNPLTAYLVAFAVIFYLIGYTMILKRYTVWNTIIGGLASPIPVLVGFSAALNSIPFEAWVFATLVFVWTPSHTWAMSAKYKDDYERARIPMLPVVVGQERTADITFWWGLIMVVGYTTLMVILLNLELWVIILLLLPNFVLLWSLWNFKKFPTIKSANTCFKTHNFWLATVFILFLILLI